MYSCSGSKCKKISYPKPPEHFSLFGVPIQRGVENIIYRCDDCKPLCDKCGSITNNWTTMCNSCTPECRIEKCDRKRCADTELCATHAFEVYKKKHPSQSLGDPINYV